jgi:TrmH family RNA methyltransferase
MMINSRDNSLLRHARAVRDGKTPELIFIEGLRLCEEALRSQLTIETLIYSDQIASKERAASLIKRLENVSERSAYTTEQLLASISYTKTPQGIIVLAQRPDTSSESFESRQTETPLLVVMHSINNPVNVGAILRTAEAAGASGAMATSNTADPFSPKSLRGAMGSAFRLPVWVGPTYTEALSWCAGRGIRTVSADGQAAKVFNDANWRQPCALIVGPESNGLSDEEIALTDEAVKIPMQSNVESLNVAVATGILLYEAVRQRSEK